MKNRFAKAVIAACTLLSLQGCAFFSGEEEVVQMAPVPQVQSTFTPTVLWQQQVGDGVGTFYSQLHPVVVGDTLFSASRNGKVVALNRSNGKLLWQIDLSELAINKEKRSTRLSGGLTADSGNLYLGSEDGVVYAISQSEGKLLWSRVVDGEVLAAPTIDSGKVVVSLTSGRLFALDQPSGKTLWSFSDELPSLQLRGESRPQIVNGAIFYGRPDGNISVVSLAKGQLVHQFRIASPSGSNVLERMVDVDATPLLAHDTLYGIAYNGELVAINVINGQTLWKRKYTSYQNVTLKGFELYLTDDKNHLYGINASNGSELWSNSQLEYRNVTTPVVVGNYVVVGDSEGYLYWFNRQSGQLESLRQLDSEGIYTAPIVDGQTLYVQTRSGKLFAIRHP